MDSLEVLTTSEWLDKDINDNEEWKLRYIFGDKNKYANFIYDDNHAPKITNTCKQWCINYKEMISNCVGIIFRGPTGTGKTFYSACIAKYLITMDIKVMMINIPTLLDAKRKAENKFDTSWEWETAKEARVLIIDDFGVEHSSEYVLSKIEELIDARSQLLNSVTIITTNLTKEQMESSDNLQYQRITSRINELCPIDILLKGCDNRKKNADYLKQNYIEMLKKDLN